MIIADLYTYMFHKVSSKRYPVLVDIVNVE